MTELFYQSLPRALLVSVLLISPSLTFAAERAVVFISSSGDQRLDHYDLDLESGKLSKREEIPLVGEPGPLWMSRDKKYLYVTLRSTKSIAAFRFDAITGAITLIRNSVTGTEAEYISTDYSGRWMLTASYNEGRVATFPISDDGSVGEKAASITKTAGCAHAILPDPSNRFILVPHTCANAVYQFRFDAKTGILTANDPPRVKPEDWLGPRHLVFHPTLDIVYFDDESASSVTAYHYDQATGTVKPFQTVSTVPEEFPGFAMCADIEITRDGRFIYVSNREPANIAAFSVDPKSGKIESIGRFKTGKWPRSFNLSPDNRWVIAAGMRSHDLTTYKRDTKTGKLTKLDVYPTGKTPSWVEIVELKK